MQKTILLFTASDAEPHAPAIARGTAALLEEAGQHDGFIVEATADPTVFVSDLFDAVDATVWLNASGNMLSDRQRARLAASIRSGSGFAGVHYATGGEPDWPEFRQIVGARFRSHPRKIAQVGHVVVTNPDHPSTAHLPSTWRWTEEWHSFDQPPSGDILLAVDTSTYDHEGTAMADPHPVAWASRFGAGRTWYTSLGHHADGYDDPLFRAHLIGGITSVCRS